MKQPTGVEMYIPMCAYIVVQGTRKRWVEKQNNSVNPVYLLHVLPDVGQRCEKIEKLEKWIAPILFYSIFHLDPLGIQTKRINACV